MKAMSNKDFIETFDETLSHRIAFVKQSGDHRWHFELKDGTVNLYFERSHGLKREDTRSEDVSRNL